MNCTNKKTRMDYFIVNMNALGVPWQKSEILTTTAVIVFVEQVLRVVDELGAKTTIKELGFAGNLFEKVKVLKAISLAGMVGLIIGSLAQSEYEYRTCGGSPILDMVNYAQRNKLYRGFLVHVWTAHPAIYNKDAPARILTAGKLRGNYGQNK